MVQLWLSSTELSAYRMDAKWIFQLLTLSFNQQVSDCESLSFSGFRMQRHALRIRSARWCWRNRSWSGRRCGQLPAFIVTKSCVHKQIRTSRYFIRQESLQHQAETMSKQHTESLTSVKKQVCFRCVVTDFKMYCK